MISALWDEEATLEDVVALYQELINTGNAWKLDGNTYRVAMNLIDAGYCVLGEEEHYGYFGERIPSRHEVVPGTRGSIEYAQKANFE